ncbi:translation initiation factor IF-2-like [Mustela erminea]|uniref:translation initiation factor IF-2-like n=1 Tax=Mustela erminea TaxID=36723 RepID=UPI001386E176|nr:translation initiation factor IF-2-like [Mustela erminea]
MPAPFKDLSANKLKHPGPPLTLFQLTLGTVGLSAPPSAAAPWAVKTPQPGLQPLLPGGHQACPARHHTQQDFVFFLKKVDERGVLSAGAKSGNLQRPESPGAACPWLREQGNTVPPAPNSPGHRRPAAKVVKKKASRPAVEAKRIGRRGGACLQPAPGGSQRDRRLEARRRDSDRGSREEEPEVAAGGSGPGEGRLRVAKLTPSHPLAWRPECLRLRDRREGTGGSHKSAARRGGSGRVPLRRRRGQRRRRRLGDCSTVPEAGREPAELGEEPPRPGAKHAAPACSARVHPTQRGGDRAEAVAPGRCLGPDRLHVSPARSHVHRLSPVRRPDVLRINKMKLRATGGQIAPGPPNAHPRRNDLPTTAVSRRSPSARPEPAGQVAALARPRPPAPPHRPGGALPQSLIKKVAKLTLPKVVVACAPLSLPAMYSLKHD